MTVSAWDFEFATATRIIFGSEKSAQLPRLALSYGSNALVVTGKDTSRARQCLGTPVDLELTYFSIDNEPTCDDVQAGVQLAKKQGCNLVIGFGGGGAVDGGKAIAALLNNDEDLLYYLEVVGKGNPLENRPAPFIAVPTTAGTGAEVTRNAVITSPTHKVKASLRSPKMLPNLAIVDPLLTVSMSKAVTAATGLDALTQLIEAFVTKKANPISDGFCRQGITAVARSIKKVFADGQNMEAREDMALGSLLSGLALANAGLGAVHGFAGPIGGMFNAPHGMICAALLPAVFQANVHALSSSHRLKKFTEIAYLLTSNKEATALEAVAWINNTCAELGVPKLGALGINEAHIPLIVEKSKNASSMKGNPVSLSDETLTRILKISL